MQTGFYFDQTRCTGCYTCVVACKDWHDVPAGPASWRSVITIEEGKFPDVFVAWLATSCYHCAKPACVAACPAGAITKRKEDGVVVVEQAKCLGKDKCDLCLQSCPYGAPQFGAENNAKMQMCNLCFDRLKEGKKPICVAGCPMRALDAGPIDELRACYGDKTEAVAFAHSADLKPSVVFKPKPRKSVVGGKKMKEQYGYAGKILRVDLSSKKITTVPTAQYADRFLGGRGIAAKIYWDEVPANVKAFDPENRIIFVTGPLAGIGGLSGSRWQVCGKAPAMYPEEFSYCNLGGRWGWQLKCAGYDALVIAGKSEKPVYLFIQDDKVEIRDASTLWGKSTVETRETLKSEFGSSFAVVACGPAGENLVAYAIVLADNDASGSSGFGAVMGSKNLKAIAVRGQGKVNAANPERLTEVKKNVRQLLWKGPDYQKEIAMPEAHIEVVSGQKTKLDLCLGCAGFDGRITIESRDGTKKGKSLCGSSLFYLDKVNKYYPEPTETTFYVNRLCDEYGVDALAIESMMKWLSRCRHTGILTDENTGIPLSKLGSWEYMEALVRKMALREGFGDVLALGIQRAAATLGPKAEELVGDYISKAGHLLSYCPRTFPAHGLLYAMEPRQAVNQLHEMGLVLFQWVNWANNPENSYLSSEVFHKIAARFWGSELAADFSTYDGKALAAAAIQDREYAKECLILCDFTWPVTHTMEGDHIGDPSIDSKMLAAVTGRDIDERGLYRIGERVFNLQRAIHIREGHKGRESDMIPEALFTTPLKGNEMNPKAQAPGKDGEITSRVGVVVDREEFERMKSEYYYLRGWDVASGLQTVKRLKELDLAEVAQELGRKGLAL